MIRAVFAALVVLTAVAAHAADPPAPKPGALRVATFNVALNRRDPGALVQELRLGGSAQIDAIAEIIQRVRPDLILLNEIDHDPRGVAAGLFRDALRQGRGGAEGIDYPHVFTAPVNTGVLSGHDLDGDGAMTRPRDAFGFGWFEGQYGMAILSRLPLGPARAFQRQLWSEMPGNLIPRDHYGAAADALRLSSKSHWDVTLTRPDGRRLHLLASHPTPPVFDGPEDANGRRNHDEIRFWVDYVGADAERAGWMTDDAGQRGGLAPGEAFVVLGDLNADPEDGDGRREAIRALIDRTRDAGPVSPGAAEAKGGVNARHRGAAARDTADWRDDGKGPGNLRVDYVLPSPDQIVSASGVFWPARDDPLRRLVGRGGKVSSDHRLVWLDLR